MKRHRVEVLSSLAVATLLCSCGYVGRSPMEVRVPLEFSGQATVRFGDARCGHETSSDGRVVVSISAAGYACTAAPFESGEARDLFRYVSEAGATVNDPVPHVSHEVIAKVGESYEFRFIVEPLATASASDWEKE